MVEDYSPVSANGEVHMDAVYAGDAMVGASSGRMLSPKTHEMISLATIDQDYAAPDTVVEVLWGNPGTRQMRIRATVVDGFYIKEGRNANFDVEQIPHPSFD